ncbi:hypothetical protein ACPPVT_07040 [Angustibacter sp. McL0619]|uniref:hypothetical protein n=1 Tax=Angustibacter sp. McL0619 TaxID=3415676 RepID=UPI003CEF2E55
MSGASPQAGRAQRGRLRWSVDQWVLRAAVLAAPLLAVGCAAAAGAPAVLFGLLLVLPAAIAAAVRPDSHWAALAMTVTCAYWLLSAPRQLTAWSLVAAALLLACHGAASVAALGPPGMRIDPTTARTWARRLAALLAATTGTWAVAHAMVRSSGSSSLVLTVLAVLVLAVLSAALGG